jgi:CopA family copper-resistance protein
MKMKNRILNMDDACMPRRRFVQGLAMGSAAAGFGMYSSTLFAGTSGQGPQVIRGNRFDLNIRPQAVNFTGVEKMATTVNGSVPAPVLRWKEGEAVTLRVTNLLPETSSIHWHGMILPPEMDGVPGISFDGIAPGETFTYQFPVRQSGTYWYHSHSGFQEQTGVYGAIVIDPKEPDPVAYDRDYVVMLSDWSDEAPSDVYAKLKKMSHYYNFRERTAGELWQEVRDKGAGQVWNERQMWNQMRMSDRDISDVTGYTYTFLMNGHTPADGWLGLFKRGEKVRLRFVNGAAMTFFDVRIPGLKLTVVATDGQNIEPVSVDEFRIGVAETYDVIVEPMDDIAYSVFAQAIDRSGYARGTLTPDLSLTAAVPEMDPAPILGHGDMGMGGMDHSMHNMGGGQSQAMDHSMHNMGSMAQKPAAPMSNGMDHSMHTMGNSQPQEMDHSMHNMASSQPPAMDHSMHNMSSSVAGDKPVTHATTEYGPHVDMRADNPQYRLDDPGIGLRNNGRRVLTYADLRNLHSTHDPREPSREIELHLTGNMSRYMWSINGVKYADADPIQLKYGERVRITLVNDTMMNHPIHLHGMWSDLETGDDGYIPRKHTVIVQPGAKISYRVTADAKGSWAYHCHLLYHMMGMFRKVTVS